MVTPFHNPTDPGGMQFRYPLGLYQSTALPGASNPGRGQQEEGGNTMHIHSSATAQPSQSMVEFSSVMLDAPPPSLEETLLAERFLKCCFCWNNRFPGMIYPEEWSSTLCPLCEVELHFQLAARQKRKQLAQVQQKEDCS